MKNLQFEGISKNLRYVFTNKGIYDFIEDKSIRYESLSIVDGIKILKEVQNFEYKSGLIDLQKHLSNPRRALITISEIFSPKETISLVNEWENKYGSKLLLINESTDVLVIEQRIQESWSGVENLIENWLGDAWSSVKKGAEWVGKKVKQGAEWVGKKASEAWKWIKDKAMAAWKCLTGNFIECLMEGLRSAMLSIVGIAVETFLAVTGIGAPIPMVLWGLMLIWDIYKMFSGKYESGDYAWGWIDILIDVIGVATAGTGVVIFRAVRGTLKGVNSLPSLFSKAKSMGGAVGKAITGIGNTIKKVGSTILGGLKKAADWIAKNFGIKWFSKWIGKAKSTVDDIGKAASGKAVTTKKVGGKGTSTLGKAKQSYSKAFDSTIGKIGDGKKIGKSTWGQGLSKSAQIAAPVGVGMHLLGVNPLTGKPYTSKEEADAAQMAQKNTQNLEKDIESLTSGQADYEAAGLI